MCFVSYRIIITRQQPLLFYWDIILDVVHSANTLQIVVQPWNYKRIYFNLNYPWKSNFYIIFHVHLCEFSLPGIKAEVGLVCEVVSVENDFHKVSLRYEGLGLFDFAAEKSRLFSIGHICFRIPVYNLQIIFFSLWFERSMSPEEMQDSLYK